MTKNGLSACPLLLVTMLAACGPEAVDGPHYTRIWIEDDADLPEDRVLDACRLWGPLKVTCALAESPGKANVRVFADGGACPMDGDDRVLATSTVQLDIFLSTGCFDKARDRDGRIDRRYFRLVLSHEFGHTFGINGHVPRRCEGVPSDPYGRRKCGPALMNEYLRDDVNNLTDADYLAFYDRIPEYSALVPY
jgi:hypothetical protein